MAKKPKVIELINFLEQTILDIVNKDGFAEVESKGTRYEGRRNLLWNKYLINKRFYEEGVSAEGKRIDKSNLIAEGYERLRIAKDYLKKKNIFVLIYNPGKMVFRKQ